MCVGMYVCVVFICLHVLISCCCCYKAPRKIYLSREEVHFGFWLQGFQSMIVWFPYSGPVLRQNVMWDHEVK